MNQFTKSFCIGLFASISLAAVAYPQESESLGQFHRALQLFKNGDYSGSRKILEGLAAAEPDNDVYLFNLANANYMSGRYSSAIYGYRSVIEHQSPLSAPAQLYIAKSYRKKGNLKQALQSLGEMKNQKLSPGIEGEYRQELRQEAQSAFAEGFSRYREGDKPGAFGYLKAASEADQNPEYSMMAGLALYAQGKKEEARPYFEQTTRLATSDNPLRNKAGDFLGSQPQQKKEEQNAPVKASEETVPEEEVATEEGPSRFTLGLEAGVGYDTNSFNVGPPSPTNPAPVSVGKSPVEKAELDLKYRMFKDSSLGIAPEYLAAYDDEYKYYSLRNIEQQLLIGGEYRYSTWLFKLAPSYSLQMAGMAFMAYKPGVNVRVQKTVGKFSAGYDLDYKHYNPKSDFSFVSGPETNHTFFVAWNQAWKQRRLGLVFTWTESHSEFDNFVPGPQYLPQSIPLSHRFYGPKIAALYDSGKGWDLEASMAKFYINYPVNALPDNVYRQDRRFDLFGRINRELFTGVKLFVSMDLIANDSTLNQDNTDNKNYTKFVGMAGVTLELE